MQLKKTINENKSKNHINFNVWLLILYDLI